MFDRRRFIIKNQDFSRKFLKKFSKTDDQNSSIIPPIISGLYKLLLIFNRLKLDYVYKWLKIKLKSYIIKLIIFEWFLKIKNIK